jgi:hypothetical protein
MASLYHYIGWRHHEDITTGNIQIARNGRQAMDSASRLKGIYILVNGVAPL